jgi:hypothetical protein
MKRLIIAGLLIGSACSCGPEPLPRCCTPKVSLNFGWAGSYVADGGVTTQAQLIRSATGEVQLTLVREGNSFTQRFTPLPR